MAKRKIAPNAGSPKAALTVTVGNAIPQNVKGFLIALAICKGSLRQTRTAIRVWRDRIEAKMPGGSRLVTKPGLVAALIYRPSYSEERLSRHCPRVWRSELIVGGLPLP